MLQAMQEFKVTLTGGFALYGLLCMGLVSLIALNSVVKSISKWIRKQLRTTE